MRVNMERLRYIDDVLARQEEALERIYHSKDPVTIRVRGEKP